MVASAVGHLFTLAQKEKRSKIPTFDLVWKPTYEVDKNAGFSKPYAELIRKLAKNADEFIASADNDIEGELISMNCIRFLCGAKNAKRMIFSTLTATDLQNAYENVAPSLNLGLVRAGEARHWLDWVWGINLSKAATSSVSKEIGGFRPLSIGRVQGPTLTILAKREREILAFIPEPYWEIFADLEFGKEATHKDERFFDKNKAKTIFEKVKNKPAKVANVEKNVVKVNPPTPFDLTSLQMEAYRCFGMSPKMTSSVAQNLYTEALISYPRTSSQKLPIGIGYGKIIQKIARQPRFKAEAELVLKDKLIPNEGGKTDPAHPAIYPTGEVPKKLKQEELALYDLITRRFLACFGKPGEREHTHIEFNINGEPFILVGSRTVKIEWQRLYSPYSKTSEIELPNLKVGEQYSQKTRVEEKETQPPKRYTPASIIKILEKNNLGTKATRAQIVDILYQRNYVEDQHIKVTGLGLAIVDTFKKFAPDILSVKLTSSFEASMDAIEAKPSALDGVLEDAKKVLIKICEKFDANKKDIGIGLAGALQKTEHEQRTICSCPNCGKGEMRVIVSRKTKKRFAACNQYPNCRTTWPIPQYGLLKVTDKKCNCGTPFVLIISKGKRPWELCVNPNCPNKEKKE